MMTIGSRKPERLITMTRLVFATILTACLTHAEPAASIPTKTSAPKTRVQTSVEDFVLQVDETKWKNDPSDTPGMLVFSLANSETQILVLTSHMELRTEMLKEMVLLAAKKGDPNARITSEEKRRLTGRPFLAVEISTTVEGIPIKMLGYGHIGAPGYIQVIAAIPESEYAKNIEAVNDFLNGIEVPDQELITSANREMPPTQGVLPLGARAEVRYDPHKWRQIRMHEANSFLFTHSSGDGFAKVLSARLSPPFDALPDIVLSNLQEEDPQAKILLKEKRKVNGTDVWFLKLEAEINQIPMIMCGYYYSGKTGTVQVVGRETTIKAGADRSRLQDHAWFAGFGPVSDPTMVVVVFVEHGGHGNLAAAPLAKALFEAKYGIAAPLPPPPSLSTDAGAGATPRIAPAALRRGEPR